MSTSDDIIALIPHRKPFLWVDKIISTEDNTIITEKTIPSDLDIFKGHFPGNPIMPGVLLCEAIFQSGALLMTEVNTKQGTGGQLLPVLTRINNAKFKANVLPGDTVRIKVKLSESLSTASFFKGTMTVDDKIAVKVEFACALIPAET